MIYWFRIKNDFINDPKMRRHFTKSERHDWVALLCLASKSKTQGAITLPDDEIAYALELTDEEWLALCAKFVDKRMVLRRESDDALVIANWMEHQHDKPSDTPEATSARKRQQRDREKRGGGASGDSDADSQHSVTSVTPDSEGVTTGHAQGETVSHPVTPTVTPCHADSHALSRPVTLGVTPCHATDKTTTEQTRQDKTTTDNTSGGVTERDVSDGLSPESSPPVVVVLPTATGDIVVAPLPDAEKLVRQLVSFGVNRADAERLARDKSGECRRQIDCFARRGKVKNPGGFLRDAIENAWEAPPEPEPPKVEKRENANALRVVAPPKEWRDQREKERGVVAAIEAVPFPAGGAA